MKNTTTFRHNTCLSPEDKSEQFTINSRKKLLNSRHREPILESLQLNAGAIYTSALASHLQTDLNWLSQSLQILDFIFVTFCGADIAHSSHPVFTSEFNWKQFLLNTLFSPLLFFFKSSYMFFKCSMSQKIIKSFVSNAGVRKGSSYFWAFHPWAEPVHFFPQKSSQNVTSNFLQQNLSESKKSLKLAEQLITSAISHYTAWNAMYCTVFRIQ